MALTREEIDKYLDMKERPMTGVTQQGKIPGTVTVVPRDILREMRSKPDEEIRAELALYEIQKRSSLQKQLANILEAKAKVEKQLSSMAD